MVVSARGDAGRNGSLGMTVRMAHLPVNVSGGAPMNSACEGGPEPVRADQQGALIGSPPASSTVTLSAV